MLNLRSSASASTASLTLRPKVRLLVRKMLRASCWVMVDPPWRQLPLSQPHLERAGDADRVDADMAAEALVLDRDHRRAHRRRDLVIGQPAAEARPQRDQQGPVGGADPDHLAKVGALAQLLDSREAGSSRRRRRRPGRPARGGRWRRPISGRRRTCPWRGTERKQAIGDEFLLASAGSDKRAGADRFRRALSPE